MKISRKKPFLNFWVEPPSQSNHSRIVLLQAHSHDVGTTPASFLFVFVLFTFQFKRQIYNFELYQLKKSVDVIVWIWTRGPQDVASSSGSNFAKLWSSFLATKATPTFTQIYFCLRSLTQSPALDKQNEGINCFSQVWPNSSKFNLFGNCEGFI